GDADLALELRVVERVVQVSPCHHQRDDEATVVEGAQAGKVFRGTHLHRYGTQRIDDGGPEGHQRENRGKVRPEDFIVALRASHLIRARLIRTGVGSTFQGYV